MPNALQPRVTVIVAAHGELAEALVSAAALIAGPRPDVVGLGLAPGETPSMFEARLAAAVAAGGAVLILADLFGGTPWNASMRLARGRPELRVVSGVNLPMLLEVVLARDGAGLDALARLAQHAGAEAVRSSV